MIRVYTDGACSRDPAGYGGWAFVAEIGGRVIHRERGGRADSSPMEMEMIAVIEALRWLAGRRGEILTDSKAVSEGVSRGLPKWKANGWRRSAGSSRPPHNVRLWQSLDHHLPNGRSGTPVVWVKGHGRERFNLLADRLAREASVRVRFSDPGQDFLRRHLPSLVGMEPRR